MKKQVLCIALSLLTSSAFALVLPPTSDTPEKFTITDQLKWVPMQDNVIPENALIGSQGENGPQTICQAVEHDGLHPGVVTKKGCTVTYGGAAFHHEKFNVLTGDKNAVSWQSPNNMYRGQYSRYNSDTGGVMPEGTNMNYIKGLSQPVIGGYEYPVNPGPGNTEIIVQSNQLRLLYICRAMVGNTIRVGKMVGNNSCNVDVDGKEVSMNAFQVLFLGQDTPMPNSALGMIKYKPVSAL